MWADAGLTSLAWALRPALASAPQPPGPLWLHLSGRAGGHPRRGDGPLDTPARRGTNLVGRGHPRLRWDPAVSPAVSGRGHRGRVRGRSPGAARGDDGGRYRSLDGGHPSQSDTHATWITA